MNKSIPPKSSVSALSEKGIALVLGDFVGGFDDVLFRKKDVTPVVPSHHYIVEMFTKSATFSPTWELFHQTAMNRFLYRNKVKLWPWIAQLLQSMPKGIDHFFFLLYAVNSLEHLKTLESKVGST